MRTPGAVIALALIASSAAWGQDFQVGARTKGMGGSYTAFEDDPTSVWLNPAGIATQPAQLSIQYQSYTQYEPGNAIFTVAAEPGTAEVGYIDPPLLPSFVGVVFQLGSDEHPHAVGIAYARPFHMKFTYDFTGSAGDAEALEEQQFSRFRAAYARAFRLRELGQSGFLPQVALGVGLDLGYTKWEETSPPAGGISTKDTAAKTGFGAGFLATLYDDTESFKVNFGAAFQSELDFDFQVVEQLFPVWDWPQMINAGFTFYLLPGQPLRLTLDAQMIDWKDAIPGSNNPGHDDFRSSVNLSLGTECRVRVDERLWLLPRLGYRRLQAPWKDADVLPAAGFANLLIDTDSGEFNVFTAGLGARWQTAEGKTYGVDIGADFGADSYNVAFGYVHEF
ncbi:MAG: hypothetical protein HYY16_06145 [Planctomycetes bacterium]|nr:hypothetical protein [Planctomycetota bacterium]